MRAFADQQYCLQLPEGYKPKLYEGGAEGHVDESFYDKDEDTILLTSIPKQKMDSVAELKKMASAPSAGTKVIGQGALPGGGYFVDTETSEGKRSIYSAVKTKTHSIWCQYDVPAAKAEIALATCKSLRAYE